MGMADAKSITKFYDQLVKKYVPFISQEAIIHSGIRETLVSYGHILTLVAITILLYSLNKKVV